VDAYGEARKQAAFGSIDNYYKRVKQERKRNAEKFSTALLDMADMAARDAVRCLEHAMVVVAGEKNVYRTIVSPSLTKIADEDAINDEISPYYRKACAASYSYVVSCVVDKVCNCYAAKQQKSSFICIRLRFSTSILLDTVPRPWISLRLFSLRKVALGTRRVARAIHRLP
jgi:hypothetical protein